MEEWPLPRPEWVYAQEARALRDMDLPSEGELRDSIECMVHRAVDAAWIEDSFGPPGPSVAPGFRGPSKPKPTARMREVLSYVPLGIHTHRWPDDTESTHLHYRNNHQGHRHTTSWGEHPGMDNLPGTFLPPPSKWVPIG